MDFFLFWCQQKFKVSCFLSKANAVKNMQLHIPGCLIFVVYVHMVLHLVTALYIAH